MNGADLRRRREALGLTQGHLADLLDTTITSVARWERGEHDISHPRLLDLALRELERGATAQGAQIPHNPFEVACFARFMAGGFRRWVHLAVPLLATVGHYQDDGTWLLHIGRNSERFDWFAPLAEQITGRCWLEADGQDQPVIRWSVPTTDYCAAQEGRLDDGFAPATTWAEEDVAARGSP